MKKKINVIVIGHIHFLPTPPKKIENLSCKLVNFI